MTGRGMIGSGTTGMGTGRTGRGTLRGWAAAGTVAVLVAAGLIAVGPLHLRPGGAPQVPADRVVPVHAVPRTKVAVPAMPEAHRRPVTWPAAGRGRATLTGRAAPVRAGTLPVWISPSTKPAPALATPATATVDITMADRKTADALGVPGVVFRAASPTPGQVHVALDYSSFAGAFGGDYASRLGLVRLPACALTTPTLAACRAATPIASTDDVRTTRLTADVTLPAASSGLVLAATSSSQGSAGNFGAEPLSEQDQWVTGPSSGAYTYTYSLDLPPVPGDLGPSADLTYNSQAVDGFTASTNNQASWIGDGWTYEPGFIEDDFPTCSSQALQPDTADLCSAPDELTLTTDGVTTPLVVSGSSIHPEADGAQQVIHTSADVYEIVEPDGTQYWYGRNKLPGYASGNPITGSRWTVPVWSGNGFTTATWRYLLDYVVDPHGDAMAYFYNTQTNWYAEGNAQGLGNTANGQYTQGGTLSKIEYGLRAGNIYGQTPAAQVSFDVGASRPDAPHDLTCAQGAACSVHGPTFWTDHALTGITTQSLIDGALATVDTWTLAQTYPDTGDSTTSPALWLASITRTGQDGSPAVALPPISFTGRPKPNLVATAADAGYSLVTRYRMDTVTSETGAVTTVTYNAPGCTSGTFPHDYANTGLCYPDYWYTDPLSGISREDWYHLYDVATVGTADTNGGSPATVTSYTYAGAAWHYDNDTVSRSANWTWDQWRGFRTVTTKQGTAPDPVTQTVTTYFQGMSQDQSDFRYSGGVVTNGAVNLTSSHGDTAEDRNQNAAAAFEEIVYTGAGTGQPVEDTIWFPYTSTATGTNSSLHQTSYVTGTASMAGYTALAGGGSRKSTTAYTYNTYGQVLTENRVPDTTDPTQNVCTANTYTVNTTVWIVNLPSEIKVTGGTGCTTAVSDLTYTYDGGTLTTGNMTKVSQLSATASGATVSRSYTYDQYGRVLTASDPDQRTTTTAYTPATGAQPTSVQVTSPGGLSTTTVYHPARDDQATSATDPGGYQTVSRYDALGRPTAVWTPGNPASGPPVTTYTYTVDGSAPSVTEQRTEQPGGGYRISQTLYDSLGRDRETQTQVAGGGTVVTDITYNSDGWPALTSDPYPVSGAPTGTLVAAAPASVPAQTGYVYDGDGRVTRQIAYAAGVETWETDTTYGGNYVTTGPPAGGVSQTRFTDGRDLTTAIYEYHAGVPADPGDPAADYDKTTYRYDPGHNLTGITDAAGDTWSYSYDRLADQLTATTPDAGTVTNSYDDAGQLTASTDARGKQLSWDYDRDGRKTAEYDTTGGAARSATTAVAAWVYDTLVAGKPTSSTAYVGGAAYTEQITGYGTNGQPAASQTVIPDSQGALAGTYRRQFTFAPSGQPLSYTDSAAGGLPAETVAVGYDATGSPTSLTGGDPYLRGLTYTGTGQPAQYQLGTAAAPVSISDSYDPQTRRLTRQDTAAGTGQASVDDLHYSYDPAGNVTSVADTPAGAPSAADVQCFRYDYLARLTQAWAQGSGACAATPSASAEGGPAPYWDAYGYNPIGDLTGITATDPAGTVSTTTDTYNPGHPHAIASAAGLVATSYGYDPAGHLTSVADSTRSQALTWNDAGQLSQVSTTPAGGAAKNTSYVYGAGSGLLIEAGPGTTTLYLPDEQLRLDTATGTVTGTRYYAVDGTVVASRTGATTVTWLVGDRHGSDTVAIDAATLTVTRRWYDPYGNPRGTVPSTFPTGQKGFVGGAADPTTGLTNLGAREYQPGTASFISPDPLLQPTDPQDLNPYAYAGDSPTTLSDPDGKMMISGDGCVGSVAACQQKTAAAKQKANQKARPKSGTSKPSAIRAPDYYVLEISFTKKIPVSALSSKKWHPLSRLFKAEQDAPDASKYIPDPIACGWTSGLVICGKGAGLVRGKTGKGLGPMSTAIGNYFTSKAKDKYVALTISLGFMVTRDGSMFKSLGFGVSLETEAAPEYSHSWSLRAGYFQHRMTDQQIDDQMPGPSTGITMVSPHSGISYSHNWPSGPEAVEVELAQGGDPAVSVQIIGWTWPALFLFPF